MGKGAGTCVLSPILHSSFPGQHLARRWLLGEVLTGWTHAARTSKKSSSIRLRITETYVPDGPVAKILCSQCRRPGFDFWSGTRSNIPLPRVCMPQGRPKILSATSKTQHSQRNNRKKKKRTADFKGNQRPPKKSHPNTSPRRKHRL